MSEALEGEIIESFSRDVAVRLEALPAEHQEREIAALLSDAHFRLTAASAIHNASAIRDISAEAATLREISRQLRLGKEIQLDAAELLRVVERRLGMAIRAGQANGTIASLGGGPRKDYLRNGQTIRIAGRVRNVDHLLSPSEFLPLRPGSTAEIYAMTDGVTDAMFEQVLTQARAKGNLSRANVARACRAKAEAQASLRAEETSDEFTPRKIRKTAAARKVMEDLTITINSLVFVLAETDPDEVDLKNHKGDIEDILNGTSSIRHFVNKVKEQR